MPLAALALCLMGALPSRAAPEKGLGQRPYMIGGTRSGHQFTQLPVSGGVVTLTRTFSGTASAPSTSYNWSSAQAGLGRYQVTVHATPYNFRRVNAYGTPPTSSVLVGAGDLHFHYEWDSTSGNIASNGTHPDLAAIELHENVDAPSSPTVTDAKGIVYYDTDDPPFAWNPQVHFDSVIVMADAGAIEDHHTWGATPGASLSSSFQPPYKADSFNQTQTYKFHDPATMASGAEEIIPGNAGPFTIKEAVIADSNSPSGYSYQVTKDGQPSLPQPLP